MDKHPTPPGFNPAPPPYYGPPQPNVIIVQAPALGPETTAMTCPKCNASISTRVESSPTMRTHLFALLLCLFGCWPCAPGPYCIDSCLAQKHYCPSCNQYLGEYNS